MSLTISEKNKLLDEFPNIKLSYEKILHKKVCDNVDLYLAIPCGKKVFLWFREINNQPCCLLIELGKPNHFYDMNIKIVNCCFNFQLSYGTIVYGTFFHYKGTSFFTLEDIFYYKGEFVSNQLWKYKFELFSTILENDIKQVMYNNNFIVIGLPLITQNESDMRKELEKIKYNIRNIQMRNMKKGNICESISLNIFLVNEENIENPKNKNVKEEKIIRISPTPSIPQNMKKREIVFKIKPDIQNDIYHLYCLDKNNQLTYYDIASIPNYSTSVMMNKLFRNIKENTNLDYLEESDDEEEFENNNEDRFVYLDREYNMVCRYNYKFKKWYPVSVADVDNISYYNDISYMMKNTKR